MQIKLSKNNDHNGVSHGVKCSQEGDRIPPLESNGQSLHTVSLVSSVASVMRLPISWISSMADWFRVPAVSTATGKKDVRGRQRDILSSRACFSGCLVYVRLGVGVRNCDVPRHGLASYPR